MNQKILCVDDDPNILKGFQRTLRKHFTIDTALGSEEGLKRLHGSSPYAIVVADMHMPGMDGIQFLARVKEEFPDTVKIMLTGQADLQIAIQAVNEGDIFRFLTKPCETGILVNALQAGLAQNRLVAAERELLQETLHGSIRVLTEILSTVDPHSFGRATALRDLIRTFAAKANIRGHWKIEVAAMLSQVGIVTIPPALVLKARSNHSLSPVEAEMVEELPELSHNLIANIPRLESVAQIVLYQSKHFDGSGFPPNSVSGRGIPRGARILKVLSDLLVAEAEHKSRSRAFNVLQTRQGWYDPTILKLAAGSLIVEQDQSRVGVGSRALAAEEIEPGHVLLSDVKTPGGLLLLSAGHELTATSVLKIQNIARLSGIKGPILVEKEAIRTDTAPSIG